MTNLIKSLFNRLKGEIQRLFSSLASAAAPRTKTGQPVQLLKQSDGRNALVWEPYDSDIHSGSSQLSYGLAFSPAKSFNMEIDAVPRNHFHVVLDWGQDEASLRITCPKGGKLYGYKCWTHAGGAINLPLEPVDKQGDVTTVQNPT